jgi:hypothetical protein
LTPQGAKKSDDYKKRIQETVRSFPAIPYLMLVVRGLLASRDLDKSRFGGAKSTIILFMILAMLECDDVSIRLQGQGCTQPATIQALLLRFLQYFGDGAGQEDNAPFKYEDNVIETRVLICVGDDVDGPERFTAVIRPRQCVSRDHGIGGWPTEQLPYKWNKEECPLQMTASHSASPPAEPGTPGGNCTRHFHLVPCP